MGSSFVLRKQHRGGRVASQQFSLVVQNVYHRRRYSAQCFGQHAYLIMKYRGRLEGEGALVS